MAMCRPVIRSGRIINITAWKNLREAGKIPEVFLKRNTSI